MLGCADRPEAARIGPREFSAEKQNLRRVVNPHQQYYERARCAVAVSKARLAEVHPQQRLSSGEQERGEDRADDYVTPFQGHGRQNLED